MSETGSISVSRLNLIIAETIRRDPRVHSVTVHGEVSGFKHHLASGHWYFSLKDEDSSVSCVMFRQNTFHSRVKPHDGDQVLVTGYVDVYPKNGTYQLYALSMRQDGTGDLFLRFEALKRQLNAEGLFDPARKKVLPMKPHKVAVVTSGSGAAWHDILNVSGLRCPAVPIVLVPVIVQGERAAADIAEGIRKANEETDADVLIVARGGGSAEDLWCFNEEAVARAVAASRIPVVSGVGHEIDTTICDLAADVRAATPSNAAEIVFPDRKELRGRAETLRIGLLRAAEAELTRAGTGVREALFRLISVSPEKRITRLDSERQLIRKEMLHAIRIRLENSDGRIRMTETALKGAAAQRQKAAEMVLVRLQERMEAMSPLRVLERGYALVTDRNGSVLTGTEQARTAENVRIRFADGTVRAIIAKDGEKGYE